MILLLLKKYLVGEIDLIYYDDIVIICNKDRKNLKPNIYINTKFLGIGSTIRGDVIITSQNKGNPKTLTKSQAIKYIKLLDRISFHYKDNNQNNKKANKKHSRTTTNTDTNKNENKRDDVLKMILAIQSIILRFINKNEN